MDQNHSWELITSWGRLEISCFLWNLKVNNHGHKSPSLFPALYQIMRCEPEDSSLGQYKNYRPTLVNRFELSSSECTHWVLYSQFESLWYPDIFIIILNAVFIYCYDCRKEILSILASSCRSWDTNLVAFHLRLKSLVKVLWYISCMTGPECYKHC